MKLRANAPVQAWFREINTVIKILVVSDILILGAAAMLAPLFAIYVEKFIEGGDVVVVSISLAIFLICRSIAQIPTAMLIDRLKGERDDYVLLIVFSLVMSFIPLLYLVVKTPLQLYAVQLLMGLSTAITYPTFMAIFTRHIDNQKEGTEWGVYYTMTDLGSAALAVVGGYLTERYGFPTLIVAVTIISVLGSLMLIPVRYSLHFRKRTIPVKNPIEKLLDRIL